MVEAATAYTVPPRVTGDTAHVALGDLGQQLRDGAARVREVERLDELGPVVEVQPPVPHAAVHAAVLTPYLVEDGTVALPTFVQPP